MRSAEFEIEALWILVFGQPPAINADRAMMIEVLVQCLDPAPPYTGFEALKVASPTAPSNDAPPPAESS